MSTQTAPYIKVTWPASAIGSFGGYRLYRRTSRAQAQVWKLLMDQYGQLYNVNGSGTIGGYTPANVQTNHREFRDYDAAWSVPGAVATDGYDYMVTAVDNTGLESLVGVALGVMVKQTADVQPWMVNNGSPFLNNPLASVKLSSEGRSVLEQYDMAGRDFASTRSPLELPERVLTLQGRYFGRTGEQQLAWWAAAANSGLPMSVLSPRGDRWVGGVDNPTSREHEQAGILNATGRLIETTRDPVVAADVNVPCGLILNGTSQYVTVPDNALINPGSGAFSLVLTGVFGGAGASRALVSKGSIFGGGNGYAILTNGVANQIDLYIKGPSATVRQAVTNATLFDGNVHSLILTYNGATLLGYMDDSTTPIVNTAGAAGAVTNAVAFVVGADNGGASAFAPITPNAVAYYGRALTAAEAVATGQAQRGYWGVRQAASAALLLDLRDNRVWPGYGTTLLDLSAIPPVLNGTAVAAPPTLGRPWNLQQLEKQYA